MKKKVESLKSTSPKITPTPSTVILPTPSLVVSPEPSPDTSMTAPLASFSWS